MRKTLKGEFKDIAKLPHNKNAFESDRYDFLDYPLVHAEIASQAKEKGYFLPDKYRIGQCIPSRKFELQTHQRSVGQHTDVTSEFEYFGIFPVSQKVIVNEYYPVQPIFHYIDGRKKREEPLELGKLVVFKPTKKHSLIYYGEESTFMLFSLRKHYKHARAKRRKEAP